MLLLCDLLLNVGSIRNSRSWRRGTESSLLHMHLQYKLLRMHDALEIQVVEAWDRDLSFMMLMISRMLELKGHMKQIS